jgi:hypothetical protein
MRGEKLTDMTKEAASRIQSAVDKQGGSGNQGFKGRAMSSAAKKGK